jgi:hypothetical protein
LASGALLEIRNFHMRERHVATILLVAVLGSGGCASRSDSGAGVPDLAAVSCPSPSGTIAAYQSDGSGTVMGAEVMATLCHVGVHAYVSPFTTPPGRALLMLDTLAHGVVQVPEGGTGGLVGGSLSIGAPSPGVYQSSDAHSCGGFDFFVQLPAPPGTDCDAGAPPACPANCSAVCTTSECVGCTLNPPSVGYNADVADDCLGGANRTGGSWRIELTSATPAVGPADGDYYLVHGTLTANVVDGSSGSAARLSLAF